MPQLLSQTTFSNAAAGTGNTSTKTVDHFISVTVLIILHLQYVLCSMYEKVNTKVSVISTIRTSRVRLNSFRGEVCPPLPKRNDEKQAPDNAELYME